MSHRKVSLKELETQGKVISPENNTFAKNPYKQKYVSRIIFGTIICIICITGFNYFRNEYLINQAIQIVKTTDFGYDNLDKMIQKEKERVLAEKATELGDDFSQTLNSGYKNDLEISQKERELAGDNRIPNWLIPSVEISEPTWEAHVRSGDGDKTPSQYIWVQEKAHLKVYRKHRFDGQRVLAEEHDIVYGTFLIDLDNNTYSGSDSPGDGWVPFWHMESVNEDWKPIPNKKYIND